MPTEALVWDDLGAAFKISVVSHAWSVDYHSVLPVFKSQIKNCREHWRETAFSKPGIFPATCMLLKDHTLQQGTSVKPMSHGETFPWNCNVTQVSRKIASCNTLDFIKLLQEVSWNSFTKIRTASYSCNGATCFSCHVTRCNRIVKFHQTSFTKKFHRNILA